MDLQKHLQNALNLGINFLRNLRHFRWTKEAIDKNTSGVDPFEEAESALPDLTNLYNFRVQVFNFQESLKRLQFILRGMGFKPSIMYIGDVFEQRLPNGTSNFVFGLMYPKNGVYGQGFADNLKAELPAYFDGQQTLDSSVEAFLSVYGAAVINMDNRYHVSDSIDYNLQIIYIGSRPQLDVDRISDQQHIVVDENLLINIWRDLNYAYKNLEQGIIADLDNNDADPTEA